LTAMVWKGKRNVNMLINMHHPPAEGNFCDEHGNTLKPATIQGCNRHKSDRMMNIYSISRWTWEWTKKLFFHLLVLIILNSYILCISCSSTLFH